MGVMERPEPPSRQLERFLEHGRSVIHSDEGDPPRKARGGLGKFHTGSVGNFQALMSLHGNGPDIAAAGRDASIKHSPATPPRQLGQGRIVGARGEEASAEERFLNTTASPSPLRTPAGGMLLQHRFCPWDGYEFRPLERVCSVCGCTRTQSRYSGARDQVLAKLLLPPWERVLWKKQPYEDNYVDRTFLESLVTNANVRDCDVLQIIKDSAVVSQHLAGAVLFLGVGYRTIYDGLPLSYMAAFNGALLVTGTLAMGLCAVWDVVERERLVPRARQASALGAAISLVPTLVRALSALAWESLGAHARALFLFFFTLATLSPLLRTLTQTISNDTVAAMAILFLSANLLCHDYRWVNGRSSAFQGTVSLNASMFVSVLLASRASSSTEVALLMGAAVQVFALAPRVYRQVKLVSESAHVGVAIATVLSALAVTLHINQILGVAFSLVILFITLVFPLTFMYIQRYKNKINGPWDEAVPTRRLVRDYPA